MLFVIISILLGNIAGNFNIMTPEKQFYKGVEVFIEGNDGEALTRFILISGRYKKSPFSSWSLYFAAYINDKKGDYRAARKLYSDILLNYPDFLFSDGIRLKIEWLDKGLKSGGPFLMREWKKLWEIKKFNLNWPY